MKYTIFIFKWTFNTFSVYNNCIAHIFLFAVKNFLDDSTVKITYINNLFSILILAKFAVMIF